MDKYYPPHDIGALVKEVHPIDEPEYYKAYNDFFAIEAKLTREDCGLSKVFKQEFSSIDIPPSQYIEVSDDQSRHSKDGEFHIRTEYDKDKSLLYPQGQFDLEPVILDE